MASKKPKILPHLCLRNGLWRVLWKVPQVGTPRYVLVPSDCISWMTANSQRGREARIWAERRNARIRFNRGPWNCRSAIPGGERG